MNRGVFIVAAIAAILCGGASFAQSVPPAPPTPAAPADSPAPNLPAEEQVTMPQNAPVDPFHGMIGAWEFSNADHDKVCHLNFRTDVVASGGYRLDIDRNCPSLFPSTKDIVAWAVDNYGSLKLLDAHGNSVADLTEVENGMYDGFTPEEGRYILQTAAGAPTISAGDIAGDWAIARGAGKPTCVLTLANSPASADALAVKIKPGCDAMVTRFNPAAWRMEQGDLVLLSQRGESWQFEQNDANTWQRVPESADPVLLVRQTAQ
jgi:Protease inhibitor Inh